MVLVNPGSSRLHAATVAIEDPGTLVDFLGPRDAAFLRGPEGFVAIGEVARYETNSMCAAEEWWAELVNTIENESEMPGRFGTGPLAYGTFCFDPGNTAANSVLVVPEIIIGRRAGQCWLTRIGYDRVGSLALPERQPAPLPPSAPRFEAGAMAEQAWMGLVRAMTERIAAGEASKVVLARDIEAVCDSPIDPRWPLRRLLANYGGCWSYLMDGLVGATPEMLLRREAGLITSRVLAGTAPRVEGVDDTAQASRLISSTKDLTEHRFSVRSVVEALAPYLTAMHVPEAPYVLTLPNLLHLATDVCGSSRPEFSTLTLANAAHPSAAVCGSPTEVARGLITEHEGLDRGRFAGPVGWVDAQGDGEWALALACGQLDPSDPRRMRIYAGAGVVADSKPHAELVETDAKMGPMKDALRS